MKDLTQQLERLYVVVPPAPGFVDRVVGQIAREPAPSPDGKPFPRRALDARRWFLRGAVAACAVLAAAVGMWVATPERLAFAHVVDAMHQAQSVSLTQVAEYPNERKVQRTVAKLGVGHREETDRGITYVYNARSGRFLAVETHMQLAVTSFAGRSDNDFVTWLLTLSADPGAKSVGRREINGRRTEGFRVIGPHEEMGLDLDATLWVDVETHLPVEAVIVPVNPPAAAGAPRRWIFQDIRFDIPLDDALFDIEKSIPPGFQRKEIPPTTQPLTPPTTRRAA